MSGTKKRLIKSLENLSQDLRDLLKKQYPNGYESAITRITNARNEPIFVFPLETDDATYLVKVPATKNSEGEYEMETETRDFDEAEDDDFSTADDYGNDDDDSYDTGTRHRSSREASYDPDFDN
ncbi:MAG: hypothetical protein KatS3mg032_1536 [Cyclobacteriaceae bacterium]|nr:MAG: hypothetical protein KatS3mg032_1536 [Cyclobacteriaceae bacterium]